MYGEIEILRMVSELRHEELMATARTQRLVKCQPDCQPDQAAPTRPLMTWIGRHLVTLGGRLLLDRQPVVVEPLHLIHK